MSLIRHNMRQGSSRIGIVSVALVTVVLLVMAAGLFWHARGTQSRSAVAAVSATSASPSDQASALAEYSKSSLAFEPNQGQTAPEVKYIARGSGYGLFLTGKDAVLQLQRGHKSSSVRMSLPGASPAASIGAEQQLPGKSNYLVGSDASKWVRGVSQFGRVRYEQVYPGVDLVYYGNQGRLEYDFVLKPGADPRQIQLHFDGASKVALDAKGNVRLQTPVRELLLEKPQVYQQVSDSKGKSSRHPVAGRFVLLAKNTVGFRVAGYDPQHELVIDPVLSYSTYLGGTGSEVTPFVAVDAGLNFYVAGSTTSTDFPAGAAGTVLQSTNLGSQNAFVAKFTQGGTLVYATYVGSTGVDTVSGLAVDNGFNAYIAGTTSASDFPTTAATAFQTTPAVAGTHIFVSKLDSIGKTLLYSTYLAGSGIDQASGIALDTSSNAYVTGTTLSADFPTTTGALQTTPKAATQFFVSKINPLLSNAASLVYSTYLGGSLPANGLAIGGGIAVDTSNNAVITGTTTFTDLPVVNAPQPAPGGGQDAFVAKLNAGGTGLVYLTYLGGSGDDNGTGIAIDTGGNTYITGSTTSTNFPIPTGTNPLIAFQGTLSGGKDAFIAKLNNPAQGTQVALTYSSYLGGTGDDIGLGVVADSAQNAFITGSTTSSDLAVTLGALQSTLSGPSDAFVAKVATTVSFSTTATPPTTGLASLSYLGGGDVDAGTSIALDTQGNAIVAGTTSSSDFPKSPAPFQPLLSGAPDAFVTRLGGKSDVALTVAATPNPVGIGSQVTFKYTITNNGPDAANGIIFTDFLPASGATFVSISGGSAACGTASGGTVTCTLSTLANAATATVSVIITPTVPGNISNSAQVVLTGSVDPSPGNNTASASVAIEDFTVSIDPPSSASIAAGATQSFTIRVTPLAATGFPNTISLSCSKGLPTGAACSKFTTNPIPIITNSSPATSVLTITTTAPTKTASMQPANNFWYATWLPIAGVFFAGGLPLWRRRRFAIGLLLAGLVGLILLQAACGGKKATTTTGTPTPPGTYTITITGTSGTITRTADITLTVT